MIIKIMLICKFTIWDLPERKKLRCIIIPFNSFSVCAYVQLRKATPIFICVYLKSQIDLKCYCYYA